MAVATAMDGPSALANVTAGNGGNAGLGGTGPQATTQNGAPGKAGNGGTANATATDTNSNGDANAVASAQAGSGGLTGIPVKPGQPPDRALPGNATATATATAPKGDATASPTAINGLGKGGTATAMGMATGQGGVDNPAARTAQSSDTQRVQIGSAASSPIPAGAMGQVQAEAMVGVAAALPALKPNSTLNAFVAAVGDPLLSDVLATSAGKPHVTSGLGINNGAEQVGLFEMGGLYPNLASGAPAVYTASASFSFDPAQLAGNSFRVGLQDAQWTGNGFDGLLFQITSGGTPFLSQSFTSLSSAISFFNDQVLNIGSIAPDSSGLLDLDFNFQLTAHAPGDGFAIDLAIAQVASVPEPPSWMLLATAIAAMLSVGAVGWLGSRLRNPGAVCPAS
jgi:hypothetical protein